MGVKVIGVNRRRLDCGGMVSCGRRCRKVSWNFVTATDCRNVRAGKHFEARRNDAIVCYQCFKHDVGPQPWSQMTEEYKQ